MSELGKVSGDSVLRTSGDAMMMSSGESAMPVGDAVSRSSEESPLTSELTSSSSPSPSSSSSSLLLPKPDIKVPALMVNGPMPGLLLSFMSSPPFKPASARAVDCPPELAAPPTDEPRPDRPTPPSPLTAPMLPRCPSATSGRTPPRTALSRSRVSARAPST